MKTKQFFFGLLLLSLIMFLDSCSVVSGIFNAGVGVGIFAVVFVVIIVVFIIVKAMGGGGK